MKKVVFVVVESIATLIFFPIAWILARRNLFWTFVHEGTAKLIVRAGGFDRALIQWKGYTLDEDWNVIREGWYKNSQLLEVLAVINKRSGRLRMAEVINGAKEEWVAEGVILNGKTREGVAGEVLEVINKERGTLRVRVKTEGSTIGMIGVAEEATREMVKDGRILEGIEIIDREQGRVKIAEEVVGAKKRKEPRRLFGGLRWVGIWPLWDIYTYRLRWNDLHKGKETPGGAIEEVVFHDEVLDYVLLRPDVYWTRVLKVETAPPERIPATLEFLIAMRIENPRKALFDAPINGVENVILRLDALFRGYGGEKKIDDLIAMRGRGETIWGDLGQTDLIQRTFKKEWGMKVDEEGIQLKDIALPPEQEEAAAAQLTQEMKARGEERRIEIAYGAVEKIEKRTPGLGRLIRSLEGMEESKIPIQTMFHLVPGLEEAYRGIAGKPPEGATPADIEDLKKRLEKIEEERGG